MFHRNCGVAATAVVVLFTAAVTGCGSLTSSTSSQSSAAARREVAREFAQAEYRKCSRQLTPLLRTESKLNSHLDIGMNYNDYTTAVGDVRAAYDQVPFKRMDLPCLRAGAHAENALNAYAKAADIWSACFNDINCSNDSIKPQLQARWTSASAQVGQARASLHRLQRP